MLFFLFTFVVVFVVVGDNVKLIENIFLITKKNFFFQFFNTVYAKIVQHRFMLSLKMYCCCMHWYQ